jgi:hypothetical protein
MYSFQLEWFLLINQDAHYGNGFYELVTIDERLSLMFTMVGDL